MGSFQLKPYRFASSRELLTGSMASSTSFSKLYLQRRQPPAAQTTWPKHSSVGPALHLQRWRFAVIWGWMPSEGTGRGIFLPLPYSDLYIVTIASSKPPNKSANPYSWPRTTRTYSKPHKNGEHVAGNCRNAEERKTKMTKLK